VHLGNFMEPLSQFYNLTGKRENRYAMIRVDRLQELAGFKAHFAGAHYPKGFGKCDCRQN